MTGPALTERQRDRWRSDRDRQSQQHPVDQLLSARGITRGEHYRRKNNGVALRTFRAIRKDIW